MDIIQVPVSPGELLDKITILEIKSERIKDADKVANVKRELELLSASWLAAVEQDDSVRRSVDLQRVHRARRCAVHHVEVRRSRKAGDGCHGVGVVASHAVRHESSVGEPEDVNSPWVDTQLHGDLVNQGS